MFDRFSIDFRGLEEAWRRLVGGLEVAWRTIGGLREDWRRIGRELEEDGSIDFR